MNHPRKFRQEKKIIKIGSASIMVHPWLIAMKGMHYGNRRVSMGKNSAMMENIAHL